MIVAPILHNLSFQIITGEMAVFVLLGAVVPFIHVSSDCKYARLLISFCMNVPSETITEARYFPSETSFAKEVVHEKPDKGWCCHGRSQPR